MEKPATTSARKSAFFKHNHLQAKRQQRWQYQQNHLHFSNMITYILREGKGGNIIRKRTCTSQT